MAAERTTLGGDREPVQLLAMLASATFVLVGIIGFIPGLTTNLYDGLEFAGDDGNAEILGLFKTSILHNLVHAGFGLVGFALARTWNGARTFLIGGGIIYLALWLLGLFGGTEWIPTNDGDDWLHLVLGLGMIGGGFITTRDRPAARTA